MRITIFTSLYTLEPFYSLASVVRDQVTMLQRYDHDVKVFVGPDCVTQGSNYERLWPVELVQEYQHDTGNVYSQIRELAEWADVCFSHDWIFTQQNLPYLVALGLLKDDDSLGQVPWLHWIHSIPSEWLDRWNLPSLGENHFIAYPNKTDKLLVAERFKTSRDRVYTIPHIKDLRTFFDFQTETCDIIDQYPGLLNANIVQVYPAASDRLQGKQLEKAIKVFSRLKKMGQSVCLFVANQWSQRVAGSGIMGDGLCEFNRIAERNGLTEQEFVLSSQIVGKDFRQPYIDGIPHHILRELMMMANVFVYPTRGESFGLVLPEISLAGGVVPILNFNLPMMREVAGNSGVFLPFGSCMHDWSPQNERDYYRHIADHVVNGLSSDESVAYRTFVRQHYNMDRIYREYYGPILTDIVSRSHTAAMKASQCESC